MISIYIYPHKGISRLRCQNERSMRLHAFNEKCRRREERERRKKNVKNERARRMKKKTTDDLNRKHAIFVKEKKNH